MGGSTLFSPVILLQMCPVNCTCTKLASLTEFLGLCLARDFGVNRR